MTTTSYGRVFALISCVWWVNYCYTSDVCPCFCDNNQVNCANLKRTKIPDRFPTTSKVINFQHNKVTRINNRQFGTLDQLLILRFDSNKIEKIESQAFYGLPMLNQLILTDNKIARLSDDIIDPETTLESGLKLKGNQIVSFPLNLLKRMNRGKAAKTSHNSIDIDDNPIECDCFSVIPKNLKRKVSGHCLLRSSREKKKITDVTYKDVDCMACRKKKCRFGSCFIDYNKVAKCRCLTGYEGDLCQVKLTQDQTTSTQNDDSKTAAKDNGDEKKANNKLAETTSPEKLIIHRINSSEVRFSNRPRVQSRTKKTGGPLIIKGCNIIVTSSTFNFDTYYLKDDSSKINVDYKRIDKKTFKMNDLKIEKSSQNDQGIYKCVIQINNELVVSRPQYVGYDDVSEIQVSWRRKFGKNRKTAEVVKQEVEEYVKSLGFLTQSTITTPKLGVQQPNFYKLKIIYNNLTPKQKLNNCVKMQSLDKLVRKNKKGMLKPMDCCREKVQGKNIEDDPNGRGTYTFASILTGSNVTLSCKYGNKTLTRKCIQGNQAPHWQVKGWNKCSVGKRIKKEPKSTNEDEKTSDKITPSDKNPPVKEEGSNEKKNADTKKFKDKKKKNSDKKNNLINKKNKNKTKNNDKKKNTNTKKNADQKSSNKKKPSHKKKTKLGEKLHEIRNMKACRVEEDSSGCVSNSARIAMLSSAMQDSVTPKTTDNIDDITSIIGEVIDNPNPKMGTSEKYKVFESSISAVNKLLTYDETILAHAQLKKKTSTKILKILDILSKRIGDTLNETHRQHSLERENLAVKVELVNNFTHAVNIVGTSSNKDKPSIAITNRLSLASVQSKIVIPVENFAGLSNPVVRVYNFRNSTLFLSDDSLERMKKEDSSTKRFVGSNVLSASVSDQFVSLPDDHFSNMNKPITVSFRNAFMKKKTERAACMFWNFSCPAESGCWMTNGCWKIPSEQKDVTAWNCSHLTNFALIIDVNQDNNNPLELKIVSYIGCGISIASLIVTIIVYLLIRKINRSLAPKMLICLSFSLLVLLLLFLIAAERATESILGCRIVAGSIQYFMLATFSWMACEGVNIYRNFIKLFKTTRNENVILYRMSVFAWGFPLIVVSCTAFLATEDMGSSTLCVVQGNGFYYGVLTPICLVLAANWIILMLSIRCMKTKKILLKIDERHQRWREIWRAFALAAILGLSWTSGVFAVKEVRDVFQWAFCVFNSLQGFFIFLFFVVRNPEIQKYLKRIFRNKYEEQSNYRMTQQTSQESTT